MELKVVKQIDKDGKSYQELEDGTEVWLDTEGRFEAIKHDDFVMRFDHKVEDGMLYSHHVNSNGSEVWETRDLKTGSLTHMKTSEGFEAWAEYTDKYLHTIYNDGEERWINNKGKTYKMKLSNGFILYGSYIIALYNIIKEKIYAV